MPHCKTPDHWLLPALIPTQWEGCVTCRQTQAGIPALQLPNPVICGDLPSLNLSVPVCEIGVGGDPSSWGFWEDG